MSSFENTWSKNDQQNDGDKKEKKAPRRKVDADRVKDTKPEVQEKPVRSARERMLARQNYKANSVKVADLPWLTNSPINRNAKQVRPKSAPLLRFNNQYVSPEGVEQLMDARDQRYDPSNKPLLWKLSSPKPWLEKKSNKRWRPLAQIRGHSPSGAPRTTAFSDTVGIPNIGDAASTAQWSTVKVETGEREGQGPEEDDEECLGGGDDGVAGPSPAELSEPTPSPRSTQVSAVSASDQPSGPQQGFEKAAASPNLERQVPTKKAGLRAKWNAAKATVLVASDHDEALRLALERARDDVANFQRCQNSGQARPGWCPGGKSFPIGSFESSLGDATRLQSALTKLRRPQSAMARFNRSAPEPPLMDLPISSLPRRPGPTRRATVRSKTPHADNTYESPSAKRPGPSYAFLDPAAMPAHMRRTKSHQFALRTSSFEPEEPEDLGEEEVEGGGRAKGDTEVWCGDEGEQVREDDEDDEADEADEVSYRWTATLNGNQNLIDDVLRVTGFALRPLEREEEDAGTEADEGAGQQAQGPTQQGSQEGNAQNEAPVTARRLTNENEKPPFTANDFEHALRKNQGREARKGAASSTASPSSSLSHPPQNDETRRRGTFMLDGDGGGGGELGAEAERLRAGRWNGGKKLGGWAGYRGGRPSTAYRTREIFLASQRSGREHLMSSSQRASLRSAGYHSRVWK